MSSTASRVVPQLSGPVRSRMSRASRCAEYAGRQAELQEAKPLQSEKVRVKMGVITDLSPDTARCCIYF